MNHPRYAISLTGTTFPVMMEKLFKHGFVFTEARLKTMKEIRKHWWDVDKWGYLTFGVSNSDCKMIVHASVHNDDGRSTEISYEDFLKVEYYFGA